MYHREMNERKHFNYLQILKKESEKVRSLIS